MSSAATLPELTELISRRPCQTNEISRQSMSAGWISEFQSGYPSAFPPIYQGISVAGDLYPCFPYRSSCLVKEYPQLQWLLF